LSKLGETEQVEEAAEPVAEPSVIEDLRDQLKQAIAEADNMKFQRMEIQKGCASDIKVMAELVEIDLKKVQDMVNKQTAFLAELKSMEEAMAVTLRKVKEMELKYSMTD